ncbi:MAG TPA: SGNH/GDSL hydrolase family protein [Tepidisphaeraceae bacterium]|jgi:lysophospholipase L1-like esterase|nr:SGNH/GDSL hydrolase family protein [Tepidisphaeraceae bacterium]
MITANAAVAPLFDPGSRVLFQGDSITDMNRGRTADPNHILGHSYCFILAARHAAAFPERHLSFINRGVSGNQVTDLAARWKADTLDLHPNVLSILIGVNDIAQTVNNNKPFDADQFAKTYDSLLAQARAANPNLKLVLCEPFSLPGNHSSAHPQEWSAAMDRARAVVEKLAAQYHAPVVHFQKVFDDACKRAPADYWIWDGIHPTYAGQELLADEWERAYLQFYGPPASTTQPATQPE